jgi:quercetin dioxygenase-like cupin family protein
MKTRTHCLSALLLAGVSIAAAQPASAPPPAASVIVAFEEARFTPMNMRAPDGPQLAVLWGEPTSGPSAMLMKFAQGALGMHAHTADYHLVVLQGTMKHWDEGQAEADAKPLGPGSYWFQPGRQVHGDACVSSQCVLYLNWAGKRDGYAPPPKPR